MFLLLASQPFGAELSVANYPERVFSSEYSSNSPFRFTQIATIVFQAKVESTRHPIITKADKSKSNNQMRKGWR